MKSYTEHECYWMSLFSGTIPDTTSYNHTTAGQRPCILLICLVTVKTGKKMEVRGEYNRGRCPHKMELLLPACRKCCYCRQSVLESSVTPPHHHHPILEAVVLGDERGTDTMFLLFPLTLLWPFRTYYVKGPASFSL